MGILKKKRIVVMGLLNVDSIAWSIGQAAAKEGATVCYTVQNKRYCDTVLLKSFREHELKLEDYRIYECDIQEEDQIDRLFKKTGNIDGVVYSVAYANPGTCLSGELYSAPREDVLKAVDISAISLAYVAKYAQAKMKNGGSIVALTFSSQSVFAHYNWMGVSKAALEAVSRHLAYDLGDRRIRVNALSAGPIVTKASSNIPGFGLIADSWNERSAIEWDINERREDVAKSAIYLLSDYSQAVTGSVHYVDGGYNAIAIKDR